MYHPHSHVAKKVTKSELEPKSILLSCSKISGTKRTKTQLCHENQGKKVQKQINDQWVRFGNDLVLLLFLILNVLKCWKC